MIAALPDSEFKQLVPTLQLVEMPLGTVLGEWGTPMQCAYFPTSSVVSLSHATKRGHTSQIALIGHEGLVGVSACLGGNATASAVVIGAGLGYRITRKALLHAFNHSRQVRSLLLRYTLALMAHMAQNVVCTRHHQLEQQFCSLLLLCCDRFPPEIILTHEQLSDMLGVRREGVTLAASHLQEAGLIRYTRGHIKILDRNGLEGRACECYALVKTECDLLLHP